MIYHLYCCVSLAHLNVDPSEDRIGPDGVEALFKDLGIDPTTVTALVLAWKVGAGTIIYITLLY